ncbi:Stk1 family PASTA domain-containing Ser/Thr kinase [Corynebacterium glutamicum]|uniref:Stk1 family PASTA domain-containing Ser/Thr kinase n=1 Tax=Corynebacterium glutamicum TaxID=1718 RepID=UPI000943F40F|nr:Stk1 family PASTA domain-containing Ser/Thr kinase [Corynebacterium glutamicum]OKX86674.1 serine/threonine protein kinase [Corynebacterium glutamicum]QDX74314.1 serine/threonine protein kinase [Corynebacterium glutamicum]QDX77072.1 serine/threonine protein kinase [Corynebacterium glutamicum]TWS37019.1 serine/threonine protein kinase [Corynebacterium glutamicum]TWS37809.1 serine/threonine protein kinase [Corynebacterium glutamicum]
MTFVIADRYELGAVIGSGGMSEVFAATDTLIGREVAVKMLRIDLAKDPNFRERFRREAQNSGRLSHPSIVAVFDTGEVDKDGTSVPYIVMERVQGRNLREVVTEDGVFTPVEAASILIPVCEALQASHDAGIIHRDVKPANIMITNTGGVKVMDFGIARAVNDSTSAMTQTSAVIGTAQYLSPEQARGKPADARSDIYATGCVMYELVTGKPPFEGESPFAVAYQHVQEDPTPPSDFIADLTPTSAVNVDAVVLTAMAKHPADRYQKASEMAADLGRLSRNAVSHAARAHVETEETPEEPETRFSTRTSTQVAPAAGVAAASAGADSRSASRKRGSRGLTALAIVLSLGVIGVAGAFTYDYFANSSSTTTSAIPNVEGLPQQEALTELQAAGFVVSIVEEASADVAEGLVIRANPSVGSEIRQGATVTITVSTGREMINIPDVSGMTLEDAARTLEEMGLVLNQNVREETSDEVESGLVIDQNPEAGQEVVVGSSVSLTMSSGAESIRVPNLTGMNWSQAEQNLISMGFNPTATYLDSQQPEGEVLSVSSQGTELPKGSSITVEVSNGMLIEAPDLARMSTEQAISALRAAGWTAPDQSLIVGEPVHTAALVDQGKIGYQSPTPATLFRKDAQVQVRLFEFDLAALVQ